MIEEQRALATQWMVAAREWILARTVPVYAWARGGLPVVEGSGVLLKIADAGFLVSAAHVMAGVIKDGRGLFMGLADEADILNLGGLDVQVSDDRDHVDVAYMRLPASVVDTISAHRPFLRLDQVDTARRRPEKGMYIVAGYPRGQTQADGETGVIHSKPYCLSTTLYDGDLANSKEGTSIVLSFTPHWVVEDNGDSVRPPAMLGISGCGIWRMVGEQHPTPGHWDATLIRLAGIEHGTVGNAIKGLLAFRLVDSIRQNHPDLAPAIELVRGVASPAAPK